MILRGLAAAAEVVRSAYVGHIERRRRRRQPFRDAADRILGRDAKPEPEEEPAADEDEFLPEATPAYSGYSEDDDLSRIRVQTRPRNDDAESEAQQDLPLEPLGEVLVAETPVPAGEDVEADLAAEADPLEEPAADMPFDVVAGTVEAELGQEVEEAQAEEPRCRDACGRERALLRGVLVVVGPSRRSHAAAPPLQGFGARGTASGL